MKSALEKPLISICIYKKGRYFRHDANSHMGQIAMEVQYLKKWYIYCNFYGLLRAGFQKKKSNPYISELVLVCAPQKYKVNCHYGAISSINSINKS